MKKLRIFAQLKIYSDITNRGKGYYKTGQPYWMIIRIHIGARVITKRGSFFITYRGKGYYKSGQVLHIGARVITKRGRYYISGQVLHIGAVQLALFYILKKPYV